MLTTNPNMKASKSNLIVTGAALILSIATTNVFNRLNVTTRQVAAAWG